MNNPYKNLKDHQFWRRGVASVQAHAMDPVVKPKFTISHDAKVATAGSCFAQHISRRLTSIGFNYFVPESGDHLEQEERARQGFGVFSARFGNLYTITQLLQLFEEAFKIRPKQELAWERKDGRFVDPFRPNVLPEGYATADEVGVARKKHLRYVKTLFTECDYFIFTLGLTETWFNKSSGDVYPLAPGVAGGSYDDEIHSFSNINVAKQIEDLRSFLQQFKKVNPRVQVLLTVSPVPLIATYEDKHVLVASSYSKSVLRVVAQMATDEFDWVDYFPSYEIITGNFNGGRYFEDDLREANAVGVSHAMRCFVANYVSATDKSNTDAIHSIDRSSPSFVPSVQYEGPIVCDEEAILLASR